jgi:hypothetical protein
MLATEVVFGEESGFHVGSGFGGAKSMVRKSRKSILSQRIKRRKL